MASIKFGTDGWRGVIAEDFTFANARIVAQAIARYAVRNEDARKGLLIGYDHRFASDRIAADLAAVISSTGTPAAPAEKSQAWRNLAPRLRFLCWCGSAKPRAA